MAGALPSDGGRRRRHRPRLPGEEDSDPALAPFLALLESDLSARPGEAVRQLPEAWRPPGGAGRQGGRGGPGCPDRRRGEPVAGAAAHDERHGWHLLAHPLFLDQLERLLVAVERAKRTDNPGWQNKADARLLAALRALVLNSIPRDPWRRVPAGKYAGASAPALVSCQVRRQPLPAVLSRQLARQGDRLRLGQRPRHAAQGRGGDRSLRSVRGRMLRRGNPPDDWPALLASGAGARGAASVRCRSTSHQDRRCSGQARGRTRKKNTAEV